MTKSHTEKKVRRGVRTNRLCSC